VPHEQGVEVAQVMPNSVAERAGVQGGDVILRAAGHPVRERMDLLLVLDRHWPQDVLPIELLRDEARMQVMVSFLPPKPPGHP
jgi:S1-C subfamily serine protease